MTHKFAINVCRNCVVRRWHWAHSAEMAEDTMSGTPPHIIVIIA